MVVTCRTQLQALCKQARRFTASTGIATLACLKPRQLQYLLRERKTPEEDIAKSETRKLQESRRPEGMQKLFVTFRICPCCLHSTSGCFKLFQASSNHAHDVKLSKQVYDSARMDILDATLSSFKLSTMPQAACTVLDILHQVSCCLRLRWGRHKKRDVAC